MALKRLGAIFCSQVHIFVLLAATLAFPPELYSQITPNREIVTVDAPEVPPWKTHWDQGRNFARQGQYEIAAEYYEELLLSKPQIEEARWEYCKILVYLGRFSESSMLLESLIEANPYKEEYLALAGYSALETGEYSRAVRYLGQVYSLDPGGEDGVKALRGLIRGLMALGKKEYAFVLMEQLWQRTPDDLALLHDLAKTAYELDYLGKAGDYYSSLIYKDKGGEDAVKEAAEMFYSTGDIEKAVPLWKKLLQTDPGNAEYHERLLAYYREKKSSRDALPHVLSLLESDTADPALLLEAARIYFNDQGRADKALGYYERYLIVRPHDTVAAVECDEARKRIANELIAIVENDGAEPLWNDLKTFTGNRLVIYQLMADKLENQGKTLPLIQVLEILYQQPGANREEIEVKLSDLYASIGKDEEAYAYLQKITTSQYLTYDYYRKRAALELQLGYDVAALDSLSQALAKRPFQDELRRECIRLAGQLGFTKKLLVLGQPLTLSPLSDDRYDLYRMYLKSLRLNGQYAVADTFYLELLDRTWSQKKYREILLLDQAEMLKLIGQRFEAQKILRMMLAAGQAEEQVTPRLIEYAIESGNVEDGWALLQYYTRQPGNENWMTSYDPDHQSLFIAKIRLLSEQGKDSAALEEIEAYATVIRDKHDRQVNDFLTTLDMEACRIYLAMGEKQQCNTIVNSSGRSTLETRFIQNVIASSREVELSLLVDDLPGFREGKGGVEDLFELTHLSMLWGKEKTAFFFVNEIIDKHPRSLRAKIEKAALLKKLGMIAEASSLYKELWRENDQIEFYQEYLLLEFKRGRYEFIVSELDQLDFQKLPIELKLLKTRTLWAMDKRDNAFLLYQGMLTPSVSVRFRNYLTEEKLHFTWKEKQKQAFWDLFKHVQPDQLDKLNALQGQEGFLTRTRTPVGEITAELYDSYRWEKLISSEYKVRKAVEEYDYIVAEKQYKQNNQEEKSTEGLKDLAKIYERLGNYGKEAEVYRYLEKQGEKTPELQESIERNRIARAPTLGTNFSYLEKKGRDDLINIQKISAGVSFKYNPSIKSSLELDYDELFYNPASGEGDEVNGRLFNSRGMYKFNDQTSVDMGLGLHILDSVGDSTPIYDIRLNRQLDELLSGYIQYEQELIDDTVEALNQSLTTNSIVGGLVLEGATGVNVGGEYEHLWYDDDNNSQNRIYLWTSYSIFSELTTYELKYSYEMFKNKDSDTEDSTLDFGSDPAGLAEEQVVLPYWSPGEYWQHLFSLRIHHLLKDPEGTERPPSYYSMDFSLGYESEGNYIYTGSLDIFLEISDNFLLKGELHYSDSSDYEEQSGAISIMYRW